MRNRYVLLGDVFMVAASAFGAFVLRFDWFFTPFQDEFWLFLLTAVTLKPALFIMMGMYNRYWRYVSINDLAALALAVLASSGAMGLLASAALYVGIIEQFSRSVVMIDAALTLLVTAAFRVAIRVNGESRHRTAGLAESTQPRRILVAGAGDAGMMVVRELQRNPQLDMIPIGFVDDDPTKIGKRIYGLPIFGSPEDLPAIARSQRIDEVTIAMPTAPGKVVRRIHDLCREAGLVSRSVPGVFELLDGQISVSRLRKVEISDLLRRDQVDWKQAERTYLANRSILVTGAGGSIGLELCRQVASVSPARLTLLGHGENSLFDAESHLRQAFPNVPLHVVVADIRDRERLRHVLLNVRPDVVFHAAAHKHVPLMENNPEEAVSNNILGTSAIVDAALDAGTRRFVLISTDKAVDPTSVMGASKRIAEAIVRRAAVASGRAFVAVRFGNVLGSRGSAVPIFTRQIESGGPVTVTDPEMRRFFMTIPEAVHLVLQAGGLGEGGELFVLKMGDPIRVVDLVQDLIRLSGADDIPIVYTGIRPGEKLVEALWDTDAVVDATRHPEIVSVTEAPIVSDDELRSGIAELAAGLEAGDRRAVIGIFGRLLPTVGRANDGGNLTGTQLGVDH